MSSTKKFFLVLGVLFAAGWGLYRLAGLFWESDAERFERWVRRVATELSRIAPEEYVRYTTLNTEGFELRDDEGEYRFQATDLLDFLARARHAAEYLKNASVDVRQVTVHHNRSGGRGLIEATAVCYWNQRDSGAGGGEDLEVGQYPFAVDLVARKQGKEFRVRLVRLLPPNETVRLLYKNPWAFRREE